jgi:hypothetical protein
MFQLYRATIRGLSVKEKTAKYAFFSSCIFKGLYNRELSEVFACVSLLMDSVSYTYSGSYWCCYCYADFTQNMTDNYCFIVCPSTAIVCGVVFCAGQCLGWYLIINIKYKG